MTADKHSRSIGDILLPMNRIIRLGPARDPVDLSAYTVKFQMEKDDGTSVIAESTTGITIHPTQVMTLNGTTALATCYGHGVNEGDQLVPATSVSLSGTGLTAATRYFSVQVTKNSFGMATTPGGVSVIAGAGSGAHTFYVVGSVQKTFLTADVDEAGQFRGWFTLYSSTSPASWPNDEYGIPIEIVAKGN